MSMRVLISIFANYTSLQVFFMWGNSVLIKLEECANLWSLLYDCHSFLAFTNTYYVYHHILSDKSDTQSDTQTDKSTQKVWKKSVRMWKIQGNRERQILEIKNKQKDKKEEREREL